MRKVEGTWKADAGEIGPMEKKVRNRKVEGEAQVEGTEGAKGGGKRKRKKSRNVKKGKLSVKKRQTHDNRKKQKTH